jgi:hypothetical protein
MRHPAGFGSISTLGNGCVPSGSCTQLQDSYDYNNRLQAVRMRLGTSSTPNANYCLVYNYYAGSNPTSCAIPAAGTGNNGSVMGYYYHRTPPAPRWATRPPMATIV